MARKGGLSRTEAKRVEKSGGGLGCTLRDVLMLEVKELARENRFASPDTLVMVVGPLTGPAK